MNSAVARDTWQGKIVDGRFPLLEWLGSSESSNVFLTELAGGKAVLKLIPVSGTTAVEEQIAQWKSASQLSHSNLIRIFDAGACEVKGAKFVFVVMEYAEEDLSQVLPVRPLSAKEAREMLNPVISTLTYLHNQNLIHGAIKPSNIMAVDNHLKVSSDHIQSPTAAKTAARTREQYDAPEVSAGERSLASDIWSLGATLTAALGQRIQASEISAASEPEIHRYVPEPFRRIARECLRRNPSERCTLQEIKTYLEPSTASVVKAAPEEQEKRSSRGVILALLITAVVIAAFLIARGMRHAEVAPTSSASAPAVEQAPPEYKTPALAGTSAGSVREQNIPSVPASARDTVTGKVRVIVRVTVNSAGEVTEANLTSPGPSKYFARLALESAHKWKFQAPIVDGAPAASAWSLRYLFGRAGTEVFPTPAKP